MEEGKGEGEGEEGERVEEEGTLELNKQLMTGRYERAQKVACRLTIIGDIETRLTDCLSLIQPVRFLFHKDRLSAPDSFNRMITCV
jgi:hypothetical protein